MDDNWHFNLEKYENGDDRQKFVKNLNKYYLLDWWHKSNTAGFFGFTLCVLDKLHRANTDEFLHIPNMHSSH